MITYLLDATSFGRPAQLHSKEGLTPSTVGAQAEAHAQENFSYFLPAVSWLLSLPILSITSNPDVTGLPILSITSNS